MFQRAEVPAPAAHTKDCQRRYDTVGVSLETSHANCACTCHQVFAAKRASEAASQPAPAPIGFVSEISSEGPSCTLCGAAMQFKCLSCGSTPAPVSQPAPAAQYRDFTETDADLFAIAEMIPETFYADRPLHFRIGRMVESWKEAVRANVMLEDKLAPESQPAPSPSCTICGTGMKPGYVCPACGSTPAPVSQLAPAATPQEEWGYCDGQTSELHRKSSWCRNWRCYGILTPQAASPAPPARTDSNVSFAETFLATAWHDDFEDQSADLVAKILQFAGDYEKWMDATKDVRPAAPPARDQEGRVRIELIHGIVRGAEIAVYREWPDRGVREERMIWSGTRAELAQILEGRNA